MKILIFLLGISFIFSEIVGGWKKDSLYKNSIYIDRSRSYGEKDIQSKFNLDEAGYISYPLEIYSQLVNGFNYKVIFAFYNTATKNIGIYSSIVYSGPFSKQRPEFTVLTSKKFEAQENANILTDDKKKIDDALDEYFKSNNQIKKYSIISTFKNILIPEDKTMVYVLEPKEGNISRVVIFKDEDGNFKVDAVIYKR